MVPVAVLGPIRIVGMAGPENNSQVLVFRGVGILVVGDDRDRCAGRNTFENAGKDLCGVLLSAGSSDLALTGAPAIELQLDLVDRQRDAGGTPFDNYAESGTVRLAPVVSWKILPKLLLIQAPPITRSSIASFCQSARP